jgi:uncharacterized protein YigA (DUF484 family)
MTTSTARQELPLADDDIASWLRANPDFFQRNSELLATLRLPHDSGSAVSLVERQIEVLRGKNHTADSRLTELVGIARSNEALTTKIHQFTRRLMRAATRREILVQIERGFREDFDTSQTVLLLFNAGTDTNDLRFVRPVASNDPNLNGFETLLATGRPRCGQIRDRARQRQRRLRSAGAIDWRQPAGSSGSGQPESRALSSRHEHRFSRSPE